MLPSKKRGIFTSQITRHPNMKQMEENRSFLLLRDFFRQSIRSIECFWNERIFSLSVGMLSNVGPFWPVNMEATDIEILWQKRNKYLYLSRKNLSASFLLFILMLSATLFQMNGCSCELQVDGFGLY
jgi:hypothetical protein